MTTTERTPDHAAKARRAASDALGGEPVIAAAVCGWPLQLGALAMLQVVPVVGLYLRKKGQIRAGNLPQRFILAVTEDQIVALAMPRAQLKGWEIRATEAIRTWPRAEVTAELEKAAMGGTLVLTPASGKALTVSVVDADAAAQIAAAL